MSILKPTLGELLDRMSILLLKTIASQDGIKPQELADIEAEIERRGGAILGIALTLGMLNARIWQLRDDAEAGAGITLRDADNVNTMRRRTVQLIDNLNSGQP